MLLQKQVQVHFIHFNQTKRHMKIIHTEHKYWGVGWGINFNKYLIKFDKNKSVMWNNHGFKFKSFFSI